MIAKMSAVLSAVLLLLVALAAKTPNYSDTRPSDQPATAPQDTSGHGSASAGKSESLIEFKGDLGLWTLVVFLVLLVVLRKWAWRPLMEAVDAREKHMRDALSEAERAREQAKALLAEHDKKLAEVQIEVR